MNNIYLIGFMGTGKTAVGRELARKKRRQFIDLDDLIELREKMLIAEIFAKKGEPYFRRTEKLALKEVAAQKKFVVACGGGIVLDTDNLKIMKATGKLICLSASVEAILKRTYQATHRPLLNVAEPKRQIKHLLKLRAPYYLKADATIDTSKISIGEVVRRILKLKKEKAKKNKFPC